jgi:SAM-dependent methyltransferase
MTSSDERNMDMNEIIERIRAEAISRDVAAPEPRTEDPSRTWAYDHGNRLATLMNTVEAKAHLPALWPAQLQPFPFNFKILQRFALKWFCMLFGRQRELGLAIHETMREVVSIVGKQHTQIHAINMRVKEVDKAVGVYGGRIDDLDRRQTSAESYLQYDILEQKRAMKRFLEMAESRLPGAVDRREVDELAAAVDHQYDALYAAFEDEYRGSRKLVRQRLAAYLPVITGINTAAGDKALDMGCGRGEWLELAQEHGFHARGVELNHTMIEQCRIRGLEVKEGDAIVTLRAQPDASLTLVSAFHVIEHLPFDCLLELLAEAKRVLRPGGVLLLETPNPTNILVSAVEFCRDPSHGKPIHPDTIRFLARKSGFPKAEAFFFESLGDECHLKPKSEYSFETLDDYVRVSRDYALIATREP